MAYAKKERMMAEVPKPEEMPSTMNVNLKKHSMPQSHLKLGAKMRLIVEGKVVSVRQDEYGKEMRLEVLKMEHAHKEDQDA